jgi:hypothetical protein
MHFPQKTTIMQYELQLVYGGNSMEIMFDNKNSFQDHVKSKTEIVRNPNIKILEMTWKME